MYDKDREARHSECEQVQEGTCEARKKAKSAARLQQKARLISGSESVM